MCRSLPFDAADARTYPDLFTGNAGSPIVDLKNNMFASFLPTTGTGSGTKGTSAPRNSASPTAAAAAREIQLGFRVEY